MLTGCGGADRASDSAGCPELSGRYAVPTASLGELFEETPLAGFTVDRYAYTPAQAVGVEVSRAGVAAYEFRWFLGDDAVRDRLKRFADEDPARYAAWYHQRFATGKHGGGGAVSAPRLDGAVRVVRGVDYTCSRGTLNLGPVDFSREGATLIAARERATGPSFSVWCGDGCRSFTIPTGSETQRTVWQATDLVQPADLLVLAPGRPQAEVARERAALEQAYAKEAAAQFAPPEVIRDRIQTLAPPGTRVDRVEFVQGWKVVVHYEAPRGQESALSLRVEQANDSGTLDMETTVDARSPVTWTRLTLGPSRLVRPDEPAPANAVAVDATASTATGDLVPMDAR